MSVEEPVDGDLVDAAVGQFADDVDSDDIDTDDIEAVEVHFPLTPDEEGWPPVPVEPIWVQPVGDDQYRLLNVPFFALGVSSGDLIEATRDETGIRHFKRVVEPSNRSTIRIIVAEPEGVEALADQILRRGCLVEASYIPALIAVDVPSQEDYGALLTLLDEFEAAGVLDYEEANIAAPHR